MKKLILVCVSFLAAVPAFGQGWVVFANTSATLLTTNNGSVSGPISGTPQWRIGLYIAPDGTTDSSLFTLIAVATNSSTTPGRFTYPVSPLRITEFTTGGGQPIAYQVKAWSLSAGETYETATSGYRGQSIIGRVVAATATSPDPALFGPGDYVGQLTTGFELTIIPEPSSLALGLLALGALALFRRRKDARSRKPTTTSRL